MADEAVKYKIFKFDENIEDIRSRDYSGKGLATYPNEDTYEGDYFCGNRNGLGVYKYHNGDSYEGEWLNNVKHGIGKFVYKEKGVYFGRFENNVKHGEGVFTYKRTGDNYSGNWKFDKKDGFGTYTYAETKLKISGIWTSGQLTQGRWIFPNGVYYEGEFTKNKPNGNGKWHFPNGNVVNGKFNQEEVEDPNDAEIKLVKISWTTDKEIVIPDNLYPEFK